MARRIIEKGLIVGALFFFVIAALAIVCLWGPKRRGPDKYGPDFAGPEGRQQSIAMVRDARRHPWSFRKERSSRTSVGVASVPLLLELLGTALDSGLTVQGALRAVAHIAEPGIQGHLLRVVAGLEIGASWHSSWEGNTTRGDVAQIHDALSFGAVTGASAAPLLYAEAQRSRRSASRRAEKRAAALGVKLVLPLGLCSLPAFIALGIVPVVMAMIPRF